MDKPIPSVGLDVHKDTIAVALAEMGKRGEVREHGKIATTLAALNALAGKLARAGAELRFCYEAGACGDGIERQLTAAGHGCVVVAPSLIPRKPGERIKTDRRDAVTLAKLHRAGELTPVWGPDPAHEAIRDLVRASGRGAHPAAGAPATVRLPAASWSSRQPAGLDTDAPALAGRIAVRTRGASPRAGGLYRGGRGGDGTARPAGIPHRGGTAGLVARACGQRAASAARHGTGGSGDGGRRTRRTSPAWPIHASSWHFAAWCRPSTPAATRAAKAASPRPATARHDEC